MIVYPVDGRHVVDRHVRAHFVLYIHEGSEDVVDGAHTSWSVDSRLIVDADLADVLAWLPGELPAGSCWSLGVVRQPDVPTAEDTLDIAWIVGADVLNLAPADRSADQQQLAAAMLTRRHHAAFPRENPVASRAPVPDDAA